MSAKYEKSETEKFIEHIEKYFPAVFARSEIGRLSGGLINSRTLSNRISRGDGPPIVRLGKKVGICRSSFIEWLLKDGNIEHK